MNQSKCFSGSAAVVLMIGCLAPSAVAQQSRREGPRPAPIVSPEVHADRTVTFRIHAPRANEVRLSGSDIPGNGPGAPMTKNDSGVWEVTLGPLDPGAYRYNFNVDGVAVIDPRNPATSESNENVWSLVVVPGSEYMDTKNVPHGAVASVTYYSTALSKFRRMHVYTPPGYDQNQRHYPVFYLLHGAGDSDDSWTSVGRAGFILDNLIAAGKAKPMIVVMPAGHTRRSGEQAPPPRGGAQGADEFVEDFTTDIMPYVEKNYRVSEGSQNRAIAGLSMGGGQTLDIILAHPTDFAYAGVFSSGLLGAFFRFPRAPASPGPVTTPETAPPTWEQQHAVELDNAAQKNRLKVLWFKTGSDDFLLKTTQMTVDLLKRHGFHPVMEESTGGHTWLNWRNYLIEFAPMLFQQAK
ncbi:MAG TPA: alpha/beta hydrolase-fold protein [Armatimonadota bacterium]|nr:alpha/beta hydrolase-fold protein [Armatimonadota bacterium]